MHLDPREQKELMIRFHKDKEFLKSCGLMDYSLLMVFLKKEHQVDEVENFTDKNKQISVFFSRGVNGDNVEVEEIPKYIQMEN
jgi:hypothetical protein